MGEAQRKPDDIEAAEPKECRILQMPGETPAITPFQECECGSQTFKIWGKWGIWYAMCAECDKEYGVFPKNHFPLLRSPRDEEHGHIGNTVP